MKRMTSLVGKGFQSAKCKTQLRLGSSRIKLLRNKKRDQIAVNKRVVADFLRNGHENNARLQVEHIISEQNLIEAYDLLYLYAERIAAQLSIIDSQKTCPPDLKGDISTLLYASSRCAELPDFALIRPMFIAKYGKDFVTTIEELRPGCGVNGTVIEKLSLSRPSEEVKLQLMKNIAAEHKVEWDPAPFEKELRADQQDLLDGPSKIISVEDLDEFPTVPSQKPILTQSDHFAKPASGRFKDEKVERINSPRPDDYFSSSSQNGRTGPPARKSLGRSAEDPPFDSGVNSGARGDGSSGRSSGRESDSFPALRRRQEEELRRYSIGVPGEKNVWVNTAPDDGYLSPTPEYSRHSRRGSIDEFDGSNRAERRRSQKYDGKKHSSDEGEHGGSGMPRLGADAGRRNQEETVSGSGKLRSHNQDSDLNKSYHRRAPSWEKARDQESGLRKAPSREGSGKGRTHPEVKYADEQNPRRASSKEGSGSKIPSSSEEGRRSREGSQHSGKYRTQDYSDEEADHVPETRHRRGSDNIAFKYVGEDVHDPDWLSEHFPKSVTTRTPRNPEDEYRYSSRGTPRESVNWKGDDSEDENLGSSRSPQRESLYSKAGVLPRRVNSPRAYDNVRPSTDDTSVKRSNLSGMRKENERSTSETLHHDSSEYEDDPRGQRGGLRKNNFHTEWSSESGEEGSSRSRQRAPRLPSVDERRKGSSEGRRYGREDARNSRYDNDESLRSEKRMSLPGGKPKYPSSDAYNDTARRATIGPEEITRGARESEDPLPRRREQKHSDRRPLPKDGAMDGSYASPKDRPSGHDGGRPRRLSIQKADDEHSPRRERTERPRKNAPPRFDDDNSPSRFINDGKQDDPATPRPRPTLQRHKTDPDPLPKTPKADHRKTQSVIETNTKPTLVKPPDLDVFISIFGDRAEKWKK